MSDIVQEVGGGVRQRFARQPDGSMAPVVASLPSPTSPSAIVGGRASTEGATILTVPAGKVWRGTVTLAASLRTAIGAALADAAPEVRIAGTGSMPANGAVLGVRLSTPASAATATVGPFVADSNSADMTIAAPAGNAVTLTLALAGATQAIATAVGVLL